MVFSGYGGGPTNVTGNYGASGWYYDTYSPGSQWRYDEDVGNLWDNSAVHSCLNWIQLNFPTAKLCLCTESGDGEEKQMMAPVLDLLSTPNPYYGGRRQWMATVLSLAVDGNAYWIKARAQLGTSELWWVPHWAMQATWPTDGSEYISGYVYTVNGKKTFYKQEDVIHFRYGIDPANDRSGLSPIRSALRQIVGDNQAASYTAAILRNFGIIGGMWSPKDSDTEMTLEEAQLLKVMLKERTTGEKRGEPLVSHVPLEFTNPAMGPEQVALDGITNYLEERICSVLGIPPGVVGLGAGLDRNTYSNYQEARQAAYENCIMPLHWIVADELNAQLLPEFVADPGYYLKWDYRDVPALQEDQNALFERWNGAVKAGWAKVADARRAAGLPVDAADEIYKPATSGFGQQPAESGGDRVAAARNGRNGNGHAD